MKDCSSPSCQGREQRNGLKQTWNPLRRDSRCVFSSGVLDWCSDVRGACPRRCLSVDSDSAPAGQSSNGSAHPVCHGFRESQDGKMWSCVDASRSRLRAAALASSVVLLGYRFVPWLTELQRSSRAVFGRAPFVCTENSMCCPETDHGIPVVELRTRCMRFLHEKEHLCLSAPAAVFCDIPNPNFIMMILGAPGALWQGTIYVLALLADPASSSQPRV